MRFSDILNSFDFAKSPLLEGIRMSRKQYKTIENDTDILVGFEAEFKHEGFEAENEGGGYPDTLEEARETDNWDENEAERMLHSWWWGDEYDNGNMGTISWHKGYRFEYAENEDVDLKDFISDYAQIGLIHEFMTDNDLTVEFMEWWKDEDDNNEERGAKALQELEDDDMEDLECLEEFFTWAFINEWLLNEDEQDAENDLRDFFREHSDTEESYYEKSDELRNEWLEENEDMDAFWDSEAGSISEGMELYMNPEVSDDMDSFTAEIEEAIGVDTVIYQDYHGSEKNMEDWYLEPDASTEWELISPPMRLNDAREAMEKVFDYIEDKGDTDSSTGLHMSVSIDGKSKEDYDLFKLIMIVAEEYVVKAFNRESEGYATPQIRGVRKMLAQELDVGGLSITSKELSEFMKGSDFEELKRMVTERVMTGVRGGANMAHLESKGYIEFRMAGDNYHKDFNLAEETMLRYAFAMRVASSDLFHKEYMTSVVKFLNGIIGIEAGAGGKGLNVNQALVDAVNKGRLMPLIDKSSLSVNAKRAFKDYVSGKDVSDMDKKQIKTVVMTLGINTSENPAVLKHVRKVQKIVQVTKDDVGKFVDSTVIDRGTQIADATTRITKALQIAA